eukprot:COSAG03_NODE_14451_length_463_cov_36.093407_1_plen_77_part_10
MIFAREDQEFQEKPEAFVLPYRTLEHPRIESFESLTPPGAGALTSREMEMDELEPAMEDVGMGWSRVTEQDGAVYYW